MKALLGLVGAFLVLDLLVTLLMMVFWLARGHVPDFLAFTAFGVWSVGMLALKACGGTLGAVQLWRLMPSGRALAGVVLLNNVLYTVAAGARARVWDGRLWGTVALNAAMLAIVAVPAAARACHGAASHRAYVRAQPTRAAGSASARAGGGRRTRG
jgi:hypothetical protein